MSKYHIWTIGCQMNKAESSRLASLFEQQGFLGTTSPEKADIIVLNTCVVRQSAENKSINRLNSLKSLKQSNPNLTIALTGCLVDSDTDHLKNTFPIVDYFFKAGEKPQWIYEIKWEDNLPNKASVVEFIPINQGCDNYCSYCIVPYRRGQELSRPLDEIICEVNELTLRGAKEVTLLGQNVDSYGHDLPEKPDLTKLLEELNRIKRLVRLRFLTNHPKDMSDNLIKAVASLNRVCEEICLPVQSGDDDILKLMNRQYTSEQYRELVSKIRVQIPNVSLSTDVIVGFPSESLGQFENTIKLLTDLKFDTVHVAIYSPREGTTAARELYDNVPQDEKKRRLNIIEQLQENIASEINRKLLGTTVEVLVEGKKKGKWYGRTRSGKLVFFSNIKKQLGQLINIKIEKTGPWSLQGDPESQT